MDPVKQFELERENRIKNKAGTALANNAKEFMKESIKAKYYLNFSWLGRPIIQYPQDMIAMQEIIWNIKPDLIIETGIAHGGSIIFYASILELIGKGEVLGIDIDVRQHNRKEIEQHPMFKRITMLEDDSTADELIKKVKEFAKNKEKILVCLDSYHSHEHVLKELKLYSPFVTKNSYLVIFDTVLGDMPDEILNDRPWDKGDNPKTAVIEFLKDNDNFIIDEGIENKLLISTCPNGYLRRIK